MHNGGMDRSTHQTSKATDNDEKAFVRLFKMNANRHQPWRVWSDFVETCALAISNSVDRAQFDVREARYLAIVKDYSRDEIDRFCQMLACVVSELERAPRDFLGSMFMELELGNHWKGQYFTPFEVCSMMARLTYGTEERAALIARRGYVGLLEPAVGAGAMVIAFAEVMREDGQSPQQALHVTAADVDATAAHMAYVQLSLLGIPALVEQRNSLACPSLPAQATWLTPVHVLCGWGPRLGRRRHEELAIQAATMETSPDTSAPAPQVEPEPKREPRAGAEQPQLQLF